MSDGRAIGVFDSGVGGLTVLRALRAALPEESTVYLGDTARVPYGSRSAGTVVRYSLNNARTLAKAAELKLLVVACNTASAVALPALSADLPFPVLGVIEPGARAAKDATKGGTVVVLGTAGTIRSRAYEGALVRAGHAGDVVTRACPLLVPLVEEGFLEGEIPRLVVERYLKGLPGGVDVVVMGCTHYPLLQAVLRAALPSSVALVDGAVAVAREAHALLLGQGLQAPPGSVPRHRLLVTDAPEQMAALAPAFLGSAVQADSIELIDVEMTA